MKEIIFLFITKLDPLLYVGAILLSGSRPPGGHVMMSLQDSSEMPVLLMEFQTANMPP